MNFDVPKGTKHGLATLTALLTASTALADGVVFTDVTAEAGIVRLYFTF
jgi:hypothetical protein